MASCRLLRPICVSVKQQKRLIVDVLVVSNCGILTLKYLKGTACTATVLYVPPGYSMYRQGTVCTARVLYVPPGYCKYRQGTACTARFNVQSSYVLPTQCIYVFCVDLRTNSHYFRIQH